MTTKLSRHETTVDIFLSHVAYRTSISWTVTAWPTSVTDGRMDGRTDRWPKIARSKYVSRALKYFSFRSFGPETYADRAKDICTKFGKDIMLRHPWRKYAKVVSQWILSVWPVAVSSNIVAKAGSQRKLNNYAKKTIQTKRLRHILWVLYRQKKSQQLPGVKLN